jgi:DNA modification methylase
VVWALRDYKTEGTIWDSTNQDCDHEFNIKSRNLNLVVTSKSSVTKRPWREKASGIVETGFCSKCNAWKGELGQEPTIELYINHMIQIFDQCKRVLKKEGTCWVVLGDTYAGTGSKGDYKDPKYENGRNGQETALNNKIAGIKDKSLCMIPERFAIRMIDSGWILRNKIIWHKKNCMPSSAKDRYTVDFEYIYFFTKSQKYYFKTQYEPIQEHDKIEDMKYRAKLQGWNEQTESYQHWYSNKKQETKVKDYTGKVERYERGFRGKGTRVLYNPNGRIKRCVWTINTKPFPEAHFATFPEELVKQCMDAGCPENGTILDMFMGSGTTALVALKNNRKFVGIELNKDYIAIANKRIDPHLKQSKLLI